MRGRLNAESVECQFEFKIALWKTKRRCGSFLDAHALRCPKYYGERGRGDRAVEGARLEIVCTPKEYRGFESPPLRHMS